MANEIRNLVKINGLCCDVMKVLDLLFDGPEHEGVLNLNNIVPMPSNLQEQQPRGPEKIYLDDDGTMMKTIGAAVNELINRKKNGLGANDCEKWIFDNWGCNNAYSAKVQYFNELYFETDWTSATPMLLKLSEKFPALEFEYRYADEDFGCNAGHLILRNGSIVYQNIPEDEMAALNIALNLWPGNFWGIDSILCPMNQGEDCPYNDNQELRKSFCAVPEEREWRKKHRHDDVLKSCEGFPEIINFEEQ